MVFHPKPDDQDLSQELRMLKKNHMPKYACSLIDRKEGGREGKKCLLFQVNFRMHFRFCKICALMRTHPPPHSALKTALL